MIRFEFELLDEEANSLLEYIQKAVTDSWINSKDFIQFEDVKTREWFGRHADYMAGIRDAVMAGMVRK